MRKIVVFSGAGLSTESGIPTYRGADQLWENYKVSDVATLEAWWRNPPLVLDFYRQRMEQMGSCEPNDGHRALARLQEKYEVINITQNIDNLLERAGCNDVRHLHGSLFKRKCQHHRNIVGREDDRDVDYSCDYEADQDGPVALEDRCPKCKAQLRPGVVWFQEAVDMKMNKMRSLAWHMSQEDGIFMVVGTSAQVYPAANLIDVFDRVRNKYIIDPFPSELPGFTVIKGLSGVQLPILADRLLAEA